MSLKTVAWFGLAWTGFSIATAWAAVLAHAVPPVAHPIIARNVAGTLVFQLFRSGTAEEPLFCGFMMTLLAVSWKGSYRVSTTDFSTPALWATLLFMLGHVDFDFHTLTISHLDLGQQFMAMCLGLFYAVTYQRTGSLLAPVLMHNYSNFAATAGLYAAHMLTGA